MAEQVVKKDAGTAKNENTITKVMDAMLGNMEHLVGSKTVIGEPTVVGDATIIPLVDVSFGVAAGASQRDCKKNGGMGGIYVRSIGKQGKGSVKISLPDYGLASVAEFEVKA